MIYSAKHNFILLKNYKVGGTSLEVELSQVLDDSAIVTPIDPPNALHKPRNFGAFYNHISYNKIEQMLGKETLDKTESVVFIRNPFDTVLSHMYMSFAWSGITEPSELDVDNYFNNKSKLTKLTGLVSRAIYTQDEEIMAKTVYKYEDGLEQINTILDKVGISKLNITTQEKAYRPKKIRPLDIFNQKHIDIIAKDWSWELDRFGYQI